jgi:hypothetical protein
MSRIEYNPSLNDKVNGQLGDLDVAIQIPLSSIKELIVPPAPEAPYKVFTAFLNQTGGDTPGTQTGGTLERGRTYRIESNDGDYTNVGAPNNDDYTYFVATSSGEPTTWGSFGLSFNGGAPIAIVLENTIGNVWFTYQTDGIYYINSDNLFTVNKTVSLNDQTRCYNVYGEFYNLSISADGPSLIGIFTKDDANTDINTMLTSKPIEIRVYN